MIRVTATNDSIDGPWVDVDYPGADRWSLDGSNNLTILRKIPGNPLSYRRVAMHPSGFWSRVAEVDEATAPPVDDAPIGHHDPD